MASSNLDYQELLERLRDSYNRRDPDAWVAVWNPDCEWHPFLTARVEGDPGYHGHNGMRACFEDVDEMFEEMQVELDQYRRVGDRLLALPARLGLHEPRGGRARG